MRLYTGGTFDLFHHGHVNFLKKCKMIADEVVVSLNSDEFILKYKGKAPVMEFYERLLVLQACRYVDKVVLNEGNEDSTRTIEKVKPDIIAIGSDWANKDYYKQMNFTQEWLDERHIMLVYIPYSKHISSTNIKNRMTT